MRPRLSRGYLCALILVAQLLAPGTSAAQTVGGLERKLLPYKLSTLEAVPAGFWEGLTFFREEEDRQRSLRADISFGLTGDEAGDQSLFRLNTGINLARGVFPSEVSVASRLFLQLRNGQLQEDLTTLQITYDYHGSHHIEYFVFAERFSDSFLSIQQRYEVGFGLRAGVQIGRSRQSEVNSARMTALEDALPGVRTALSAGRTAAAVSPAEWAAFERTIHNLHHAIEYRQTPVFLGVAVSVFSEIENAALEVASLPLDPSSADAPVRSRLSLGPEQRYRVSIRPSFRWRPSESLQVIVLPYFKLPLDGARYATVADGSRRFDYRRDILSEMSWSVRREQTGLENVSVVFTFNNFRDNVPPAISERMIADARAAGRRFDRTAAEGTHRVTALSLRLSW